MGGDGLGLAGGANLAAGRQFEKVSHAAVIEAGNRVRESLFRLLQALLPHLES